MALDLESSINRNRNKMMSETLLFKGNKVEVTSDEEGFKGAWYIAKIVKTSSKTHKGKALVEYESLLADDEKSLLKEYVDPSFIRPLPPETKKLKSFEVFDVVDAFYQDGWWKGVIVLDFGEEDKKKTMRYSVIFDNPPDQIEFGPSTLRFHLDWLGGSWVKPKKQKRMEGLKFSKGMAVVVNIDEGIPSNDWFEAVVLEEVGFNSFLVKLSNTKDESGLMKPTVDSFHLRPPLPNLESKNFQLLEEVYVLYCSGWRLGVITKILTEGRFTVTLKHLKLEMEFCHSDIRPIMDFINGSWVHYCKEASSTANGQLSGHANNNVEIPKVALQLECSRAAKDTTEKRTPCNNSGKNPKQQSHYNTTYKSKKVKETTPNSVRMLSYTSRQLKRQNSTNALSSQSCHVKPMLNEKINQEAEAGNSTVAKCSSHHAVCNECSAKNESPVRVKIAETNLEEAEVGNEMMRPVEEGKMPSKSPVKKQPVLIEGGKKDRDKGCSAEGIAEVECIIKEVDLSIGLAEGIKGSCSHVDTMNAVYSQEQPSLANNNAKSVEIAVQLESSSAAKRDNNGNIPCTNSEKNPMQHSISCNAIYSSKTACMKVNKTSPNSEPTLLPPCKKFRVDKCANCLSSLECCAKLMPIETPNQGAAVSFTSQTEHLMHHVAYKQAITEYEIPFKKKNDDETMISVEDKQIPPCSQVEGRLVQKAGVQMQETNQPGTGIEDETMISVEDGGMKPFLQVTSQLDLTARDGNDDTKGDSAKEIELEHVTEEVGLSIPLAVGMTGSDAEESYQVSDEETNDGKQRKGVTSRKINIGEDELNNNLGEEHNVAGGGAINMDFENPATKEVKLPTAPVEPVGMLVCQPETVERGNDTRDLQVEMITQYLQMDASVDGELAEHQLMPFVKNSPVWDMVESLEVFQRMPQKPHFNPLVKCKEFEREGSAIGKMVQFATVVEKTSKLQVGDPRTVFDSYLETLADLKSYGFDVEPVVYRINGLLSIKESQVQLQSKSKEVETQIAEGTCDRTKLEEDIEAIDKKIRELEEERVLALSMKENRDSEITNLRMQSSGVSADISKAILDFETLATASW